MAKVNIVKPTGGSEALGLVSAFNAENNVYIIFDSEKTGSMGLPIIYVSKLVNDKLEKISDTNEWQSVKNYLKGIINGTNFLYVKVNDSLNADEAFYTPLTLPQASFDLIKQRYVVKDTSSEEDASTTEMLEMPSPVSSNVEQEEGGPALNEASMQSDVMPSMIGATENIGVVPPAPVVENSTSIETPAPVQESAVNNAMPAAPTIISAPPVSQVESPQAQVLVEPQNIAQVMPDNNVASNTEINSTPVTPAPETPQVVPEVSNVAPTVEAATSVNPQTPQETAMEPMVINSFSSDKETFLKACENMFDALVSKYQKQIADLERREQELNKKEQEIEQKMQSAEEHLANAEAREQVANIAHDNAQKVMDLTNLMPVNPDNNQAGVI